MATKLTLITENGLYFRGRSAVALSADNTLEDVAALLWGHDRATIFPDAGPVLQAGVRKARAAMSTLPSSVQAISLLSILEASSTRNYDQSAAGFATVGAQLLR